MKSENRSQPMLSLALGTMATLSIAFSISAAAAELELSAKQPTVSRNAGEVTENAKSSYQSDVYIVQMADAAVASYKGGVAGLEATSPLATGARKLDLASAASKSYEQHLMTRQSAFIAQCEQSLGHSLDIKYAYRHAFNGLAIELSSEEVDAVRALPNVKSVTRERFEVPTTDAGPQWIGAPAIWNKRRNGSMGEGTVIAVLDTGVNHDHPSYADIGSDGFDHTNPLGSGNFVPGSYCDVMDPSFCNDKLIGAWSFVPGDANFPSPEDDDGHGSHTSSTAGGNMVSGAVLAAPTTTLVRDISGVAPHANLIVYDVCVVTCPGSALLAAIEQVVIDAAALPDGIHALNYSISGGGDPYNDPVELGFLAATEAGVYVSASAGNAGPGASTNGHNGPWVSTTAAMTHNRAVENTLVDLNSAAAPLPDIAGLGLTSGFGPAPIIDSADLEGAFPGSTLCGLGVIGDFNPPWPPGTFNGEIVACTRGTFGRVEKGANVLAAGAGGYILMDNGAGLVGDAHELPGVHISQADGDVLRAWLAANPNPMGSIAGFSVNLDPINGDVMAGFSSRGPNAAFDVVKPDIGAPGVDIFAAEADGQAAPPEYQFLSGTSMASPHNAGSGALLSATHPDWTPYQIRSALMMTAQRNSTVKEDGLTPTDPFDVGAGRINLKRANRARLLLDESPENFLAANPDTGGDPRTLNIASMQHGDCLESCSWSRTVTNVSDERGEWEVSVRDRRGLKYSVKPRRFRLNPGQSRTITVEADTLLAPDGWNFADLRLRGDGPNLSMPIAVFSSTSTDPVLFNKTVDKARVREGRTLTYAIDITNGPLTDVINLTDEIPRGLKFEKGSTTEVVTNGTTISSFEVSGRTLSWSGTLDPGGIDVVSDPFPPAGSPFGYVDLSGFVAPLTCSSVCDDTSITLSGLPPFTYDGNTFTELVIGSNGLFVPGTDATGAFSPFNQDLPDAAAPNPLAPFWADLDLDGTSPTDSGAGNMYAGVFNAGTVIILEWQGVEEFAVPGVTYTFQVQIATDLSGNPGIWFVYNALPSMPAFLTVGAENALGTAGSNYFFDGTGTFPITGDLGDLRVVELLGGTASFSFQAEVKNCNDDKPIVNRAFITSGSTEENAIASTKCRD